MFPTSCERVAISLRGGVTTKFPVESRKSMWRQSSKGCFVKGTMSVWHHICFPGYSGWCCFPPFWETGHSGQDAPRWWAGSSQQEGTKRVSVWEKGLLFGRGMYEGHGMAPRAGFCAELLPLQCQLSPDPCLQTAWWDGEPFKAGDVSHSASGTRKPLISRHHCKAGSN